LKVNDELRAMTKSERNRESSVMMSSVMPSEKYSCSGSSLMLVKGSTAMDGLSGSASGSARPVAAPKPSIQRHTRTGLAIFLSSCSPASSNVASTLPET
jgi:hypothetical protein